MATNNPFTAKPKNQASTKGTALVKALNKAEKKVKVHKLPTEKKPKTSAISGPKDYYYPPTLYLDQKDFPGIDKFEAGKTVNLAITAQVQSVNMDDNGKEKRYSCSLKITEISDITPKPKGAGK